MKLPVKLNILLLFCSCGYAKLNVGVPYLKEARRQSANQSTIEKLSPFPNANDSGSGYSSGFSLLFSSNGDLQAVIKILRSIYLNLDTLLFDSCCQPKFLGLDRLSPSIFPMQGGSSSMTYAYCDMNTEGGGWMVILRRITRKAGLYGIAFGRSYRSYKHGFGRLNNEYWLGLIHLHHFTSQPGGTELRVELMLNGTKYVAHYDHFFVDSENTNFTLRVGGYRNDKSNISDSLSHSNGFGFSGSDFRNHYRSEVSQQTLRYTGYCSLLYGYWWFGTSGNETCTLASLLRDETHRHDRYLYGRTILLVPKGYMWVVDGQRVGFDSVEMKIRPKTWECGTNRYTDQVTRLAFLSHHEPSFNPFQD